MISKIAIVFTIFTLAYLAGLLVIDTKIFEFRWDLIFMFWAGMFCILLTKE